MPDGTPTKADASVENATMRVRHEISNIIALLSEQQRILLLFKARWAQYNNSCKTVSEVKLSCAADLYVSEH